MKVLMGTFVTESNANVPAKTRINHYDMAFGEDCLRKMNVADIYAAAGIETIGAIYADAGGNGVVTKDTFDYIEGCFADAVRRTCRRSTEFICFCTAPAKSRRSAPAIITS